MGLSHNRIKLIKSLKLKKHRSEQGLFVAEGDKLVSELLETSRCSFIAALPEWIESHPGIVADEIESATAEELSRATFLKTAPPVIALFRLPEYKVNELNAEKHLCLSLDGVQDPGNMGTITRIADWFGIEHIICSPDTADLYNPKTVQATMGAVARVKVAYAELTPFLRDNSHLPIYGTFLDGENIYSESLSPAGIIVMGSEGKGVSKEVEQAISKRLFIPSYPPGKTGSESLNVAAATAIVCSEFRRRM